MKRALYLVFAVVVALTTSQVFAQRTAAPQEGQATQEGRRGSGQRPGARQGGQAKAAKPTPVALKDGVASLSPENSKVDFVGTHVGDEPKPRLGGFKKFKGKLAVTDDGSSVKSLSMEFETGSLWTEMGAKLTDHLKTADFLDVKKYPSAKFVSKKVTAGDKKGMLNVVGDFTLMGKTKEITIPVMMKKSDKGVVVKGDFKLDRISFGMTKKAEQVSKEVSITLAVGEKTTGGSAAGGGQASGQGGRRGRRGRDPAAMFKNQDANGDGKLTGDEIPQFFKGSLDAIDTNGDEAITLEELKKRMQSRGQGGERPQRGGDR